MDDPKVGQETYIAGGGLFLAIFADETR